MSGAQNYAPGGLSKPGIGGNAYGGYSNVGGGGLGNYGKLSRKDSSTNGDKISAYGGYNYGGGGISKYLARKNAEQDPDKLPSVPNRQALDSGVSIGSRRNFVSGLGSKGSNRSKIGSGGGLSGYGGVSKVKKGDDGLPTLNKYSKNLEV